MYKQIIKAALVSLCVLSVTSAVTGCTPTTSVPTRKVRDTAGMVPKTVFDRSKIEVSTDNWKPVQDPEQLIYQRNPFRGFKDTILAEARMRQQSMEEHTSELQLPEQLYGTRDYKVVGVITGTADPKVYIVDPAGNRFILRRGSLIGNNNGSISSIRRDGIEVYERVADKGQYIELPLYDTEKSDKKSHIQLSLQ